MYPAVPRRAHVRLQRVHLRIGIGQQDIHRDLLLQRFLAGQTLGHHLRGLGRTARERDQAGSQGGVAGQLPDRQRRELAQDEPFARQEDKVRIVVGDRPAGLALMVVIDLDRPESCRLPRARTILPGKTPVPPLHGKCVNGLGPAVALILRSGRLPAEGGSGDRDQAITPAGC